MAAAHRAHEARDVVHFLHDDQSVFLADDFMIAPAAHALSTRTRKGLLVDQTVCYVPKKFAEGMFFSRKGLACSFPGVFPLCAANGVGVDREEEEEAG